MGGVMRDKPERWTWISSFGGRRLRPGSQSESKIAISIETTTLMPPTVTFRQGLDGIIGP
jgi:hypothetical protein